MATHPSPAPARRTQKMRREATRAVLMDATLELLVAHGYAKTTTTMISARAGVSRGALLHHFPSKEDLMLAAVAHVSAEARKQFRAAMAGDGDGGDAADEAARLSLALDGMWRAVQGPSSVAWFELVVAARTNPALHAKVVTVTEEMRSAAQDELAALGAATRWVTPAALQLASALMDGLLVQQMAGLSDDRRDEILELLRRLILPARSTLTSGDSP